ncbi:class I SAM-dependent methyltransferase [Nocardioides sp. GCM10027113]|uniref:class I SAM-dependent methyltransferase n=1 Tax=unclassified Nocardioides TaxID=2615069 RepID=UPI00361780C3
MDDDELRRRARSFGPVADAYDRGRPGFPAAAAAWLAGTSPVTVLELGAGTGKLTEQLVALGHDVHATDPDGDMLGVLGRKLPAVRTSVAGAEEIPAADRSVDVVVAAQSFHWFDHERALPEIARILRPGGRVALTWNVTDERIPWVRRLGRIIGSQEQDVERSAEPLVLSPLFGFVDEATFPFWQTVDRHSIQDLAASRSNIATLDEDARADLLRDVLDLYDDYGRGMDGMQLPYNCRCYRAAVNDRREPAGQEPATDGTAGDREPAGDRPDGPTPPPSDGPDTDMLLIDFR